jgi:hypothetical protein
LAFPSKCAANLAARCAYKLLENVKSSNKIVRDQKWEPLDLTGEDNRVPGYLFPGILKKMPPIGDGSFGAGRVPGLSAVGADCGT